MYTLTYIACVCAHLCVRMHVCACFWASGLCIHVTININDDHPIEMSWHYPLPIPYTLRRSCQRQHRETWEERPMCGFCWEGGRECTGAAVGLWWPHGEPCEGKIYAVLLTGCGTNEINFKSLTWMGVIILSMWRVVVFTLTVFVSFVVIRFMNWSFCKIT